MDFYHEFDISIAYMDGKKTNLTAFGKLRDENKRAGGSQVQKTLSPGKEISEELPISRYNDFSLDGKYTIVVQKKIPSSKDPKNFETVTSNKLEITIDDKLTKDEMKKVKVNSYYSIGLTSIQSGQSGDAHNRR